MKQDKKLIKTGSYVLATKYGDGDPCDHFCVGWVSGLTNHNPLRYLCCDEAGLSQRTNGFRRAECITPKEGKQIVALMSSISDKPGASLWWHLAEIRKEKRNEFCHECRYEKHFCRCC